MKEVDSVLIGAGQAAPSLAVSLAANGQQVVLIEGNLYGGTCVNVGCTPTKTLRKSARVAHLARRAAEFGVMTGPISVDFPAAIQRMRDKVEASRHGLVQWLEGTENLELIHGWGRFEGRDGERFLISVNGEMLSAAHVYLNTGTRALTPDLPGLDSVPHLDNASLLALNECPEHLLIVGASYIGLELGQIYRRLGARVSIIHRAGRIAEREDDDISAQIAEFLRAEGIEFILNSSVTRLAPHADGVSAELSDGSTLIGSHILFATGRIPNVERLNLAAVGVETDKRGFIRTDAHFNTNVAGIKALGDINGRGAFTHTSYHDYQIAWAELDGQQPDGQWLDADRRVLSYAMFTDPPLGRVGITLAQARERVQQGQSILVADIRMADVSRAKEESETDGMLRLIVDAQSERFLGAAILGIGGDEIIAVISNYMATGASYRLMMQALPVHPTVAEFFPTVLMRLRAVG
ncbi:mercuric reductase [Scandinavium sp. V105_16]|uniref:Mercuric reductase n=1 Tax=Scandinavium lactucae TaxID=3095028 RepID=A0AAJ2S9E7_9ENTR|nr:MULTISPECIES: mercuric reductase [unclassified Scandinavium]MDX6022523.1 mercuric reductase [Scandinavium sp. V105_16]MDX6033635.1 mercuric reductase [Scandinavium sp. V105_12]